MLLINTWTRKMSESSTICTVVPVLIWRGNSFCMFTSKNTWLWIYTSQIMQRWWKMFNIGCALCIFASILVNFWPILKILFSPESLWKLQLDFYSHWANKRNLKNPLYHVVRSQSHPRIWVKICTTLPSNCCPLETTVWIIKEPCRVWLSLLSSI